MICAALAAAAPVGIPSVTLAGQPKSVVARVNGNPLTRLEVQSEIERLLPTASYHGAVRPEAWRRVVDRAIEGAVDSELAYQEAVKRGVKLDSGAVEEREKAAIARAGSEAAFEEALRAMGMSRADYRDQQKKGLLAQRLYEQLLAKFAAETRISDADLKAYYEKNTGKFIIPESVDVQHLLIRVPPWASSEQWERDARRSEWIAGRARKGEDFGELVRTYSDDALSKGAQGRMSSVHGGKYADPIRKISEGLQPGEIGGPARTLYGYHIVKLLKRQPERLLSFADVNREQLREDLRRKAMRERLEAWRRSLREAAEVVFVQDQVDLLRSPPER